MMIPDFILLLIAYVLGSMSWSVWIGRKFYNIDVREHGSKNAGATNVFRVLGKKAGWQVMSLDMLKGAVALSLYYLVPYQAFLPISLFPVLIVASAMLGHIFPLFTGFKGGKGVATLCGALIVLLPFSVMASIGFFFLILILTHYVSLGSILAGISFPIFTIIIYPEIGLTIKIMGIFIGLLLIYTHRKNIRRMLDREENKTYLFRKAG